MKGLQEIYANFLIFFGWWKLLQSSSYSKSKPNNQTIDTDASRRLGEPYAFNKGILVKQLSFKTNRHF